MCLLMWEVCVLRECDNKRGTAVKMFLSGKLHLCPLGPAKFRSGEALWFLAFSCDLILYIKLKLTAEVRHWFLFYEVSGCKKVRRAWKCPRCGRCSRELDGLAACKATTSAASGYCIYDSGERSFSWKLKFDWLESMRWSWIDFWSTEQAVEKHAVEQDFIVSHSLYLQPLQFNRTKKLFGKTKEVMQKYIKELLPYVLK